MRLCVRELCVRKALLREEGEAHAERTCCGSLVRESARECTSRKRSERVWVLKVWRERERVWVLKVCRERELRTEGVWRRRAEF